MVTSETPSTQGKSGSIKQTSAPPAAGAVRALAPNFRNLGAVLRIVVLVNMMVLVTAAIRVSSFSDFGLTLAMMAHRVEFPLLIGVLLLFWLGPWLSQLLWRDLTMIVCCVALALAVFTQSTLFRSASGDAHLRSMLWAVGAGLGIVAYFRWRMISQMPALNEARIMALTSRIRPHFFFNSLNGVLGVIRSDPKRAELALESLAELFRELMQDSRDLVTLCDEIELCNRYLDLERLRLGDRLKVAWELKHAPLNARVPPVMLQPLIENAVYHGIEPSPEGGLIDVRVTRRGNVLEILITNPAHNMGRRVGGNNMALGNIRERLALFFDVEASLRIEERDGLFKVRVRIPLRREKN